MKTNPPKRYQISSPLKKIIKENSMSMRKISKKLGFEVKNIVNKNKSISETHLRKLEKFLNKKFYLKEFLPNNSKNLGIFAESKKIKKVRRNENLAEFIGIMLGDGNILRTGVKIAFNKRDLRYINHVTNLFENIFGIKLKKDFSKKSKGFALHRTNKFVLNELIKQGLKPGNKIKNNLGVPIWIKRNKEFSKRCIKGLIDTDGCIYRCKRENQTYVKFTNFNEKLLDDFKVVSQNLGYSFTKANKRNLCLYKKEQVARFIKEIKPLKSMKGVVVQFG